MSMCYVSHRDNDDNDNCAAAYDDDVSGSDGN